MNVIHLYVSVPLAGFRVAQAREFWETYPCPPPSTVYGMLLSLVGEPDRLVHQGAEIAIVLLSNPQRSVILRTLWRVKNPHFGPGQNPEDFRVRDPRGGNRRPDFQELLTDIQLSLWIRRGNSEKSPKPLVERLYSACVNPRSVSRFGGLSLGESTHLVNEARLWRHSDPIKGRLLVSDDEGNLSMPIWPDHVGSRITRWGQFRLNETTLYENELPDSAWITICPPGNYYGNNVS